MSVAARAVAKPSRATPSEKAALRKPGRNRASSAEHGQGREKGRHHDLRQQPVDRDQAERLVPAAEATGREAEQELPDRMPAVPGSGDAGVGDQGDPVATRSA